MFKVIFFLFFISLFPPLSPLLPSLLSRIRFNVIYFRYAREERGWEWGNTCGFAAEKGCLECLKYFLPPFVSLSFPLLCFSNC
jgi:hypothetical protein